MTHTEHQFSTRLELNVSLRYLLHLPKGHAESDGWPLVLFLHGSGERGDDVSMVRRHGLPRLLEEGLELPAVVVSPQCPADQLWTPQVPALRALVDKVAAEHRVDRSRVAVTGLSLGGAGAYELVARYPDAFAAVAPICGPWTWMFVTEASARVPTWVFHGDADRVVHLEHSERLVAAIRERGGEPRFTVYQGVGHDSWDRAYSDPEVLAWLLEQRRR